MTDKTTSPNTAREAALALLEKMVERDGEYTAANDAIAALGHDDPQRLAMLDDALYQPLLALIDAALGEDVGSYFYNEARTMTAFGDRAGGCIIEQNGTRWPIRTVGDVRAYLEGAAHAPAA